MDLCGFQVKSGSGGPKKFVQVKSGSGQQAHDVANLKLKKAGPPSAPAHGLRGRNFWKNHDFAPMQFNSFD